jgi:hypothetical protein
MKKRPPHSRKSPPPRSPMLRPLPETSARLTSPPRPVSSTLTPPGRSQATHCDNQAVVTPNLPAGKLATNLERIAKSHGQTVPVLTSIRELDSPEPKNSSIASKFKDAIICHDKPHRHQLRRQSR